MADSQPISASVAEQVEVEYRQIPGHPGYRFGSDGSAWTRLVRTYQKGRRGPLYIVGTEWVKMRPAKMSRYFIIKLAGSRKLVKLHLLLLRAFVCPRPDGMVGRHLDDNPENNVITNLAWGTHSQNSADAIRNGHMPSGDFHVNTKLSESDVSDIRAAKKYYGLNRDLAKKHGVSTSLIKQIRRGVVRVSGNPRRGREAQGD